MRFVGFAERATIDFSAHSFADDVSILPFCWKTKPSGQYKMLVAGKITHSAFCVSSVHSIKFDFQQNNISSVLFWDFPVVCNVTCHNKSDFKLFYLLT